MTNKKKFDKKWLIGIAVGAVILSLILGIGLSPAMFTAGERDGRMVLYHTPTCPLCQNVKDYIGANGIAGITQKDISANQAAARELSNRLIRCGQDVSRGMPVPVLWAKDTCFIGEVEIINYLKSLNTENEQS